MRNVMMIVAALGLGACQPDTRNIEKKLDELNKKIDNLQARGGVGPGAAAGQQRAQRPQPDAAKTYSVPIEGDPFDGPADAKVTIVKAYDYACPFCERVRETMDQIRAKYPNDVRIVYKQFVVHPTVATAGALAFCAAGKHGKAIEMDKLLWDKSFKTHNFDKDATENGQTQKCWESAAGCPVVLGYAQELGLNADTFKADMKACVALKDKDMRELQQLGVGATPSFFINGRFISGAVPIENFTGVIEEELKKANDKIGAGTPAAQYYQQWVVDKGQKTLDAPKQ